MLQNYGITREKTVAILARSGNLLTNLLYSKFMHAIFVSTFFSKSLTKSTKAEKTNDRNTEPKITNYGTGFISSFIICLRTSMESPQKESFERFFLQGFFHFVSVRIYEV